MSIAGVYSKILPSLFETMNCDISNNEGRKV
jgi:hypothetical protein